MTTQAHTAAEASAYEHLMSRLLDKDARYNAAVAEYASERDARIQQAQQDYDTTAKKLNELGEHVKGICSTTTAFARHAEAPPIEPHARVPLEDCARIQNERLKVEEHWNTACRDHAQLNAINEFDEATRRNFTTNRTFQLVAIFLPVAFSAALIVRAVLLPVGG